VFSGIVQAVAMVKGIEHAEGSARITIERPPLTPELAPGASIAVNGVCLTVEGTDEHRFHVTAVAETLGVTTLHHLRDGSMVNLEPALRVGDPLGGHWVSGHVDGVGRVRSVERTEGEVRVAVEVPAPLRRYIAPKGSLAVDGVSLTVASWSDPVVEVALVPYTLQHTSLRSLGPGHEVNLEADLIARYLDRLLEARGLGAGSPIAAGERP
jgi:riboflavin synthase alpha subunit